MGFNNRNALWKPPVALSGNAPDRGLSYRQAKRGRAVVFPGKPGGCRNLESAGGSGYAAAGIGGGVAAKGVTGSGFRRTAFLKSRIMGIRSGR
jgi:hypothetical protein